MNDRIQIARSGLKGALKIRNKLNISKKCTICPIDVAENLNIEVRIVAAPSLEGMYSKSSNAIILSSQRPIGRKNYTCAHEIAHWWFGHGNCIDETGSIYSSIKNSPQENLANDFASHLMMPVWAIKNISTNIRVTFSNLSPIDAYKLSTHLNVGYTSLLNHLLISLKLISIDQFQYLIRYSPKQIKSEILNEDYTGNLPIVSYYWESVPIDIEVNDKIVVPNDSYTTSDLITEQNSIKYGKVFQSIRTGICQVFSKNTNWCSFIRICKKDFTGRSIYRHLEDDSDE